ncbi:MAG: 3-deoxy-D-manno-octulosonate 8-phosphate phosphatase [Chitinophagaceae bacterium]|nr:3-deoxy-D-manno-octulosonate 8-phosphate phosphatase [Chitinophagaceae bacterium]
MSILKRFKSVSCFVFDVDGVLTDGSLLVLSDGVMARRMNIKDGFALQLAIKKGYHVLVISGGNSPEVKDRLEKLGISNVWMQVQDKEAVLSKWMKVNQIVADAVLYMGDDVPDLSVMQLAGLQTCPLDAAIDIKNRAHFISAYKGGEGCVREVIEKVMKLRGDWGADTTVRAQ